MAFGGPAPLACGDSGEGECTGLPSGSPKEVPGGGEGSGGTNGGTLIVGGLGPGGAGVTTLNIDPASNPDIVGDINTVVVGSDGLAASSFNTIVFETLPFAAYAPAETTAIGNAAALLAPGGRLIVVAPEGSPFADIFAALDRNGFQINSFGVLQMPVAGGGGRTYESFAIVSVRVPLVPPPEAPQ